MSYQKSVLSRKESDTSSSSSNGTELTNVQPPSPQTDKVIINIHNTDDIYIENIQEEQTLMDYTNDFIAQRMNSLEMQLPNEHLLEQRYMRCDSPITVSNYGSRNGSSHNSDLDENEYANEYANNSQNIQGAVSLSDIAKIMEDGKVEIKSKAKSNKVEKKSSRYKQLAYDEIEQSVDKYYDISINDNKISSEIDILITFMKGQKNLYIQSKNFSQLRLNALMIPSILITGAITVMSPFITCENLNKGMISILNGIAALFISLMNYFKLETSTEMYLQMATFYDKMETTLEMTSSRLIVIENEAEKRGLVLSKIQDVEQKMMDTKETNHVLVPEQIKTLFPIISHINVFSFLKKMEGHKQSLLYRLKDVKNEIRFILYKWKKHNKETAQSAVEKKREQKRLELLYDVKEKLKVEIMEYRAAYGQIDEIITREINMAEKKINAWGVWYLCCWSSKSPTTSFKGLNPVIDKYFHFIFADE